MTSHDESNHAGIGCALILGIALGWICGTIYFQQINSFLVWSLWERP